MRGISIAVSKYGFDVFTFLRFRQKFDCLRAYACSGDFVLEEARGSPC